MWSGYRPSARVGVLLFSAALGLGLWSWLYRGSSPGGSQGEALGALLAQEGLQVTEAQLLEDTKARGWSEGRGWVPGFALAREAQEGGEAVEDIYYLEARVDAQGAPLQVRRVSNLTRTPYAREHLLAREGSKALLGVEVFGAQQSLLLVDFAGDERDLEALGGWSAQAKQEVTNLQQTGRAGGVGMRLYGLEPAARRLSAQARGGGFSVSVVDDKGEPRALTFGPEGLIGELAGVQYQPRFWASKATVPWVVDTIRDLSFVGPRKVALLEQFVFRWKDNMQQTAFQAGLVSEDGALQEELGGAAPVAAPSGPAATLAGEGDAAQDWPPPPVKSAIDPPSQGEGQWAPVEYPWLRTLPGAPPAFYRTAVRTDAKRPYDAIALVAADMRQLDLGMVAGTVTPESSFGNRGDGLVPRAPEVLDRLVAAFNGGFKTAHGAFGMIVDRTTILPPIPYSATLAVQDDGQVKMGTWHNSMTPPPELRSLRQNLPPLMADGKFNPTGKRKWGGTASDLDDIHTTRSGVGIRAPHTLVYAWCKSCSADALGAALLGAGCEYGMHLDMNPTHTGWSYYRADTADLDDKGKLTRFEVAKASPRMDFEEGRYVNRDVKDFFYLTLRRDLAMSLPSPPQGASAWSAAHAPRGHEGFLPLAAAATGPGAGDLLVALEGPSLRARARLGDREPGVVAGRPAVALQGPVALLDLGLASDAPGGVLGGGATAAPLAPGQPALWVDADGRWALLTPQEARERGAEAALLRGGPALIKGGEPVKADLGAPGARQHALGVDARGRLFYLTATGDAAALAARLRGVGVVEAMLLPPGPQARLRFIDASEGALSEVDPISGDRAPLRADRGATTHLWLERGDAPARVARLALEDVTLDPEEEKRQARLQAQIKALREELRRVENAKYQKFIEKKNGGQP